MPGRHINKRKPGYQSNRTERQQARILDALTDGPMSSYQLMERLHMSRKAVIVHLSRLMEAPNRKAYVCGYDMVTGRPKFIYDIGSKRNVTVAAYQMKRMLEVIEKSDYPLSAKQVGDRIGISVNTARRYILSLKKKGKIHIAKWVWASTSPLGLYVSGPGEDAPKLKTRPLETQVKRIPARTNIFAALGL